MMNETEMETKIAALEDEIAELEKANDELQDHIDDLQSELTDSAAARPILQRAIELLADHGIIDATIPHTRALYVNGERELP